MFVYRTFMAGVVLLLKHAKIKPSATTIVIDVEYHGKDKILRGIFREMWSRYFKTTPDIRFRKIGKRSNAHWVAYLTMKGKRKPNVTTNKREITQLTLLHKKTKNPNA